jgi:hypothetical protein
MKTSKWSRAASTALVGLLSLACGATTESPGKPTNRGGAAGAGGGGSSTAGGGAGGSSGSGGGLADAGGGPSGPVLINSVSGRVIDDKGNPMRETLISVCGDQCYNGETDANGRYLVEMGVTILAETFGIMPHVDFPQARFYAPLPAGAKGQVQAPDLHVLTLPDGPQLIVKSDNPDAPKQTVTAGDVTLAVDAGVQVILGLDDVILDTEGKKLRAMKVPANMMPNFAKPEAGLRALYALGPFHVEFKRTSTASSSAKAQLSIKNTLGMSANQTVEFMAIDFGAAEPGSKPGSLYTAAKGKVSSDGALIEMNADQSLKYLDWVGVR